MIKIPTIIICILMPIYAIAQNVKTPQQKKYDAWVKESLPELDMAFNFHGSNYRSRAVNNTIKVGVIARAIQNGYHIDPAFLEIPKYTCKRCYSLVSINTFKPNYNIIDIAKVSRCMMGNMPFFSH